MNKTIIIAIVAVILTGGYFLFFKSEPQPTRSVSDQSSQQPPVSQAPAVKENVITYSDAGFSPETLTIAKGDTVVFENQSSKSMWVASALHPTHRVYPTVGGCLGSTFDACQGVELGGRWSFKFDISGTWKYHDHLSPGDTGTIIVQ